MCDAHEFVFDVDSAFADQLVAKMEASPEHPLTAPEAPRKFGVYVLYQHQNPVYVGQAVGSGGIASRLRDHSKKVQSRRVVSLDDMSYRFLVIARKWEVIRARDALIRRFSPEWSGMAGPRHPSAPAQERKKGYAESGA